MDLRQLSTFRAAARTGSFAQTALDLHYAPSTVTEQVRALEASMDASLFERHGRGVRLTQAGRRLLPYAERLVDMAEDARRAVAGEVSITGSVTIGGLETLCAFRLPRALASMRRSHPELRVQVRPASRPDLERALLDGEIEIALTLGEPFGRPDLESQALRAEPLALIVSPDHPLAANEQVTVDDLASETFLLTEVGCSFRALVDSAFAGRTDRPVHSDEFASVGALKRSVTEGIGVTLLPEVAVADELASGKLMAPRWNAAKRPPVLRASWRRDRGESESRRVVLQHLRAELADDRSLDRPDPGSSRAGLPGSSPR